MFQMHECLSVNHCIHLHTQLTMLLEKEIRSLKESLLSEEMKRLFNDFKCKICDTISSTAKAWKQHMTSHSSTFSCDTCKKTFNNKKNLTRHSKTHLRSPKPRTKTEKYSCSLCHIGLINKIAFYSHMKTKHETRTQSCPDCGKAFYSKAEVTAHHKKAHTDYPRHLSCDKCDYTTNSKYNLNLHNETHSDIMYPCDVCKIELNTQQSLRHHMRWNHGEKSTEVYNCPQCNREFKGMHAKIILEGHLKIHDANIEKNYKCTHCEYKTWRAGEFKKHSRIHEKNKEDKYFCDKCPFKTWNNKSLYKHQRSHGQPVKCKTCGEDYSSKDSLTVHMRHVHGLRRKDHICDVCNKLFRTASSLSQHIQRLHENTERTFRCSKCDKAFLTKGDLNSHLRNHNAVPHFKCDLCSKEFKNGPHLERHKKLHSETDLKPFKCTNCSLSFRENYNLKRHMDGVHGDREGFKCSQCDKTYKFKSKLLDHIDIIHNIDKMEKIDCKQCEKSFPHITLLRSHERNVHVEADIECQLCGRKFKVKGKLTRHLGTVHKEAIDFVCSN